MGDGDKVEDVLKQIQADEIERMAGIVANATEDE
jgi:hypothetical protein